MEMICQTCLTNSERVNMSEVKNITNRLKILYLYKIMLEQTDEQHPITMSEIINQLKLCGISAERKALYQDLEA